MPRGDGTGPLGMGPMTGRSGGSRVGSPRQDNPSSGPGRGRGWCSSFNRSQGATGPVANAPMDRESEIEVLKEEAASLEKTLKNINERLATLQGGSSAGSERKG